MEMGEFFGYSDQKRPENIQQMKMEIEEEKNEEYLTQLKEFRASNKLNQVSLSSSLTQARFFVLKAANEDDLHKVWLC